MYYFQSVFLAGFLVCKVLKKKTVLSSKKALLDFNYFSGFSIAQVKSRELKKQNKKQKPS